MKRKNRLMLDDPESGYIRRAFAAYYRSGATNTIGTGEVVRHNGLTYVVLGRGSESPAVYRIRNDGMLKRMKRWPEKIS